MPIIEIGNAFYFMYILIAILLTSLTIAFLRHKSDKFRYWFIFGILMVNLSIHFLKLLIFPYNDPYYVSHVWVKASLENICAFSVVLFPLMYFSKNTIIKDFMVMLGIASGILAITFPADAIGETFNAIPILYTKGAFDLETIRFYTTHFLLFLAPFLIMHFKQHQLSIKRIIYAPMLLTGLLFVLFFNELILSQLGWVPAGHQMMDPSGRNPSLIFGIKDLQSLTGIGTLFRILVPKFLTVNPFTGETFYWPVVWMIGPVFVYGSAMAFIFALVYDKQQTLAFVAETLNMKQETLVETSSLERTNND